MPRAKKPSPPPPARKRVDWEAIERDYRTGRFTLRELEAKHGTNNATIARKIKADRETDPARWQRDLTKAVRDATNAKLMEGLVSKEISKGQQEVSKTVLAAAEANTQIILAHRRQLRELGEYADKARAKLMELGDSVADVREAVALMAGVESYNRILKSRIEKEREAYALNDPASKQPEPPSGGNPAEDYAWYAQQGAQ